MHEKHFLQASVSIRCRRCSCRLDKTLTSSFSRTSPTTTPLLGLHPAVLYLSPRFLLPTLHYPHAINVVHLINLSIRHITSATPTKLSNHSSPYRSQRAFRRVPGPAISLWRSSSRPALFSRGNTLFCRFGVTLLRHQFCRSACAGFSPSRSFCG